MLSTDTTQNTGMPTPCPFLIFFVKTVPMVFCSLFLVLSVPFSGYFEEKKQFLADCKAATGAINFYDSNTGKLLFSAPKGRTMDEFLVESRAHGWPSFRDPEVNWELVRCLPNGETVSIDGELAVRELNYEFVLLLLWNYRIS